MLYFFVNPASRSGKGAGKWEQVEQILNEKNISYHYYFDVFYKHVQRSWLLLR